MKNYEKKAFIKIFLGYFITTSIFVLILGYLYFLQQNNHILIKTAMNMHQYVLNLKQSNFSYEKEHYSFDMVNYTKVKNQLPKKDEDVYYKVFTHHLVVYVDAKVVDKEIYELKSFTIILQVLLIIFFFIISYILAKKSLQPMIESFNHLDNFNKDLIHDLNTPITSILLNTRMLKKFTNKDIDEKIIRIENSAKNILSLYDNLEIILKDTKLTKETIILDNLVNELISIYKNIYPNIKFNNEIKDIKVFSNKNALKRILDNIISNSCKYSKDNAYINIDFKDNTLIIEDNGKGIKYPEKIFQRNYKEYDSGYGIGMHIVYRLCHELNHTINIKSKENIGTKVSIKF